MAVLDATQFEKLCDEVKQRLLAESQGVGEVQKVDSLSGIYSLPALKGTSVVEAPLELLSRPAEEAAVKADEAAEQAIQIASEAAEQALSDIGDAVANAQDTANHPTYIGEDNYVYIWDKQNGTYNKTSIYVRGEGFKISKIYGSIGEMNADTSHKLKEGDFVLINTNDVENPDNAKIYVLNSSGKFDFLVDMSGAIGFTGKTPQMEVGTVTVGIGRGDAGVTLVESGTDGDGNPIYLINIKIPSIILSDFSEDEIKLLQSPANEMIAAIEETDATIKQNEELRNQAEEQRELAENVRKSGEVLRETSEQERREAEEARVLSESERDKNEKIRKSSETSRINNENVRFLNEQERILAENERFSAEGLRNVAENSREEAELARQEAEGLREEGEDTRNTQEQVREENESLRKSVEDERVANESVRQEQESTRQNNETMRQSAERGRENSESERSLSESARMTAEIERENAEQDRSSAENSRAYAENTRQKQELYRESAERQRESLELERQSQEQERQSKETERESKEETRQSEETVRQNQELTRERQEEIRQEEEAYRAQAEKDRADRYAELENDILEATQNANDAANESRNTPVIRNGTWWIWDIQKDAYSDTGTPATSRSPQIFNQTWWTWDDANAEYVDTGQSVSSEYQLTKEKIEGVFKGDIQSHYHGQYALAENVPEDVSELNNDMGYVTSTDLEEKGYATVLQLNKKQDVVEDLQDIRNGAALGATALQEIPDEYITSEELEDKGYATTGMLNEGLASKQPTIADLETIRGGAALGATAIQEIPSEYVTESELEVKDYATNSALEQGLSGKQPTISDLESIREGATLGRTAVQKADLDAKGYATSTEVVAGLATKQDLNLYFTDVVASEWFLEKVFRDFKYRCDIPCEGVNANMLAEVIFGLEDASRGDYASVCETGDGVVSVWSSTNKAIVIPTIVIYK